MNGIHLVNVWCMHLGWVAGVKVKRDRLYNEQWLQCDYGATKYQFCEPNAFLKHNKSLHTFSFHTSRSSANRM